MNTRTESELLQSGYRYALSLTRHREDAEDLVQQAWLNLTKRYKKVENVSILRTAVRNKFYDHCRRAKVVRFEALDDAPGALGKHAVIVDFGTAHDMHFFLSQLSADSREALYLNVVEGYSAREIGERVGKPRNTVLSMIRRAKHKLKNIVESAPATQCA